jgi:hypothetical protein
MIDTRLVGITEEEMTPAFFGGTGKMEMFYGEGKTYRFTDGDGKPVANTRVRLATAEDGYSQTQRTNADGMAAFDILSVRYFKYGNSLEHGGVSGTPGRTDYRQYVFSADGYQPCTVSAGEVQAATSIIFLPVPPDPPIVMPPDDVIDF